MSSETKPEKKSMIANGYKVMPCEDGTWLLTSYDGVYVDGRQRAFSNHADLTSYLIWSHQSLDPARPDLASIQRMMQATAEPHHDQ